MYIVLFVGFPSFVGLLNLLNMVLLFWPTPWLAHDSWHIQDWFEVFKERKKKLQVFCLFLWFISLVGKKTFGIPFWVKQKNQPSSFSPYFGATQSASLFFKWVTFLHLIFGVSCGLFLEIWFTFVRYFPLVIYTLVCL